MRRGGRVRGWKGRIGEEMEVRRWKGRKHGDVKKTGKGIWPVATLKVRIINVA